MHQIRNQARGKCSASRVNLTQNKGNWQRQQGQRPRPGTKVGKVTKGKNWNKNHNQKQRRPYCVFHGESTGHNTKDYPKKRDIGKDEEQTDCPTSDTAERKRGQHHLHNWPPVVLPNVPSAKRKPNTSLHTGLYLLPKLPTSMVVSAFAAASGG